jgi:hypothetical protein
LRKRKKAVSKATATKDHNIKNKKKSLLANKAEGHGFQNQFVDNKPLHNPNGILSEGIRAHCFL